MFSCFNPCRLTTSDILFAGRDTVMQVAKRHAVNGNPTTPPFPENMENIMFGEYAENVRVC